MFNIMSQDFHHDSAILDYKPQHLAIACLFLAFQCYGVSVPTDSEDDGTSWFMASFLFYFLCLKIFALSRR